VVAPGLKLRVVAVVVEELFLREEVGVVEGWGDKVVGVERKRLVVVGKRKTAASQVLRGRVCWSA